MSTPDATARRELTDLNLEMVRLEQQGDAAARTFFDAHLAPGMVFRRASGKVTGKSPQQTFERDEGGFLAGLASNPFAERTAEDISVTLLDDRALVALVVVGRRKDDGSRHRYRNVRLFSRIKGLWTLELWYNYELV